MGNEARRNDGVHMDGYHTYDLQKIAERYDLTGHSLFELISRFGESDDY
jgi:hypothetical protein